MNDQPAPQSALRRWLTPTLLFALTFLSTLWAGSLMAPLDEGAAWNLLNGLSYAVPVMTILLAHELGHFFAAKLHGVQASPPFFIPLPLPPIGTFGAIIQMRGRIRSRNALLDIGAAGPLAGMVIALPVLLYGLSRSEVGPPPGSGGEATFYYLEGHSLLYEAALRLMHDIPEGHDILLHPIAWAGWVGLLVTMINLIPFGQLDGGHIAYALLGTRQDRNSRRMLWLLPLLGAGVGLYYALPAWLAGADRVEIVENLQAGMPWLIWTALLLLLSRMAGIAHPPTDPGELSPKRRWVAIGTLVLFALIFMPAWLRLVEVGG